MKYEIKQVLNGWVISAIDEQFIDDHRTIVSAMDGDGIDGFRALLAEFIEEFGPSTSRYDKKRLRAIVIPGDKYEGKIEAEYRQDLIYLYEQLGYGLYGDLFVSMEQDTKQQKVEPK